MSRRVITPEIFDDEWFGQLEDRRALIWIGLFGVVADDQGRFTANPAVVRSRLFVYRDVPVADVADALDAFAAAGKLHRYDVGERAVYQIVTFWKHQRPQWAAVSDFPPPEGWSDRVRTRLDGEYLESPGWKLGGGFGVRVNASPEAFTRSPRANLSREPFGLAHEPEPVPEPVPDKEPEDLTRRPACGKLRAGRGGRRSKARGISRSRRSSSRAPAVPGGAVRTDQARRRGRGA